MLENVKVLTEQVLFNFLEGKARRTRSRFLFSPNLTRIYYSSHIEMFEDFETCAQREILEETNLSLPKDQIKFLTATNNIMAAEEKHYVTIFMSCQINPEEIKNVKVMEPHKLEGEWQWVTLEELKSMDKPLFSPLQKFLDTQDLTFLKN